MSVVLSEHLPLLATAPDGIQQLRGLIYEVAARGLLVESDVDIPARSVKLGDVAEFVMGQAPPGSECNTEGVGTIFVKTGEFGEEFPVVREWTTKPLKFAKLGDVLICVVGATVGKLNLAIDCAIGRSVAAIRPSNGLDTRYLYSVLVPFTLRLRKQSRGSAQGVIGKSELGQVIIRLPDLAEQHRIVAKVDELMALCDRLEAEQADADAAHAKLVETLLGTLTQSTDAADLAANWQRLAEHFDTLFTTESSLDALKQTILQLAVMGKLVPQDPNDEPASELLKRIAKERARLEAEGICKKSKPMPAVGEDEQPFAIPSTWQFERLGFVSITSTGKTPPTSKAEYYGDELPFIGPGQITPAGEILQAEKLLSDAGRNETTIAKTGNILMVCIGGSIGKAAIANKELAFNQQINCANPILVSSKFLYSGMRAQYFQRSVLTKATGSATPIINRSNWDEIPLPIPPLAEQHRIVAKVDELMAFCDNLKADLAESRSRQARLSATLIESALAAA